VFKATSADESRSSHIRRGETNMRFISPRIHGVLDYTVAALLIGVPIVTNVAALSPVAAVLSITAGIGLTVYSLVTDYAAGVRDLISWPVHLTLDAVAAGALLTAPFLLGFDGIARVFYVAVAIAVLAVVATTQLETDTPAGIARESASPSAAV
jgi:hypothetical protein